MSPLTATALVFLVVSVSTAAADFLPDPLVVLTNCRQGSASAGSNCSRPISNDYMETAFTDPSVCTQTDASGASSSHWWQADIADPAGAPVTFVRTTQMSSCCNDINYKNQPLLVSLDDDPCLPYGRGDEPAFGVQAHFCNRTGSRIRVGNSVASQLILCQVSVYAEYLTTMTADYPQLPLSNCSYGNNGFFGCNNSIDGDLSSQAFNGNFSVCTYFGHNSWWQADTQNVSLIKYVRIYGGMLCCTPLTHNVSISVDGFQCAFYSGSHFTARDFLCNRTGRVLHIDFVAPSGMIVCEVQAFGRMTARSQSTGQQLALKGCSQSSIAYGGVCGRAIDNSTLQNCSLCSRTNVERGWWKAKTEGPAFITFIRVFLSTDCCFEGLHNLSVTLDMKQCLPHESGSDSLVQTFHCNETGKTIKVNNNGLSSLALCEVQAFGEFVTPVMQNRTLVPLPLINCTQSSVFTCGRCQRAIDGNTNQSWTGNSCTKTRSERSWWRAQTAGLSHIASVTVYSLVEGNRSAHGISDIRVRVSGGRRCSPSPHLSSISVLTFKCPGAVGQGIEVRNRMKVPLQLCEVRVLGWPVSRQRVRGPGRRHGRRPGKIPGRRHGKRHGQIPGRRPDRRPGRRHGKRHGRRPGRRHGKRHGKRHGRRPGRRHGKSHGRGNKH